MVNVTTHEYDFPNGMEKYNIKIITEQSEKNDRTTHLTYNFKGYEITLTRNFDPKGESEYGFRIESDVVTTVSGSSMTGQEIKGMLKVLTTYEYTTGLSMKQK